MIVDSETYEILRMLTLFLKRYMPPEDVEDALRVINTLMLRARAPAESGVRVYH